MSLAYLSLAMLRFYQRFNTYNQCIQVFDFIFLQWNIHESIFETINRAMLIKSFFYSFISYKIPYHLTSIHLLCESVIFFTTQICPSQLDNKLQQSQRKCGIQEVIVLSKIWTNIKFPDRFSIALQITLYQEKKFYFFFQ